MTAAPQHDRSEFITWHLCLLILVGFLGFGILSVNMTSLAIPLVIAILPLPFYCVPQISNEAAKTCLYSAGVALLFVLVIYAAGFGALLLILRGMTLGW